VIWHIAAAVITTVVAVWCGWQAATRHRARRLRDHHDHYGANLLDPNGERS
jgi:hypothetical protein